MQMQNKDAQNESKKPEDKSNEKGQILVDSFIKIHDPNTKEVFVSKRDS